MIISIKGTSAGVFGVGGPTAKNDKFNVRYMPATLTWWSDLVFLTGQPPLLVLLRTSRLLLDTGMRLLRWRIQVRANLPGGIACRGQCICYRWDCKYSPHPFSRFRCDAALCVLTRDSTESVQQCLVHVPERNDLAHRTLGKYFGHMQRSTDSPAWRLRLVSHRTLIRRSRCDLRSSW